MTEVMERDGYAVEASSVDLALLEEPDERFTSTRGNNSVG